MTMIKPGDVLFFYLSKGESYAASQSITTIGIAEQVINVSTVDDLVRHTAKRSVFSADELAAMTPRPSENTPDAHGTPRRKSNCGKWWKPEKPSRS